MENNKNPIQQQILKLEGTFANSILDFLVVHILHF